MVNHPPFVTPSCIGKPAGGFRARSVKQSAETQHELNLSCPNTPSSIFYSSTHSASAYAGPRYYTTLTTLLVLLFFHLSDHAGNSFHIEFEPRCFRGWTRSATVGLPLPIPTSPVFRALNFKFSRGPKHIRRRSKQAQRRHAALSDRWHRERHPLSPPTADIHITSCVNGGRVATKSTKERYPCCTPPRIPPGIMPVVITVAASRVPPSSKHPRLSSSST